MILATTNLSLVSRRDPGDGKVEANGDDTDDPDNLAVVHTIVAEDNGEDDAAEIAGCADNTGYYSILRIY